MTKYIFTFLLLSSIAATEAEAARPRFLTMLSYDTALPLGGLSDYTTDFSYRGISFEARAVVRELVSVGALVGWNVFHTETTEATTVGNVTAHGLQLRTVNAVPIMASTHLYTPVIKDRFRLYGGINVGTYWSERSLNIGLLSQEVSGWQFGLAPEAGIIIATRSFMRFVFNVKYNYAFETDELSELNFLGFNFGFAAGSRSK